MNFFNKLERKYGRYAIHNLMHYIIILYIAGIVISWLNPQMYYAYLSLDAGAILQGQIWRVVTFLIFPPSGGILFNVLAVILYYSLGMTLERIWGAFRFNVYFFTGVLGHVLAAFIIYFLTGISYPLTTFYLNNSLFLVIAVLFPEAQFYLNGLLPIKAKWMGLFIGGGFLLEFFTGMKVDRIGIGVSLLNFVLFLFVFAKNSGAPQDFVRKQTFKTKVKAGEVHRMTIGRHKCAVCGRTEKDDPNLEFRYCSKCEGNLEYCMDHLYTHKHVTKEDTKQ